MFIVSEQPLVTYYQTLSSPLVEKLNHIKLVVFDVDGTLSDSGIFLDRTENELKKFNCKDGMGISLLIKANIKVALLTGRNSPLTARRAKELGIQYVIQGKIDKEEALLELLTELNMSQENLAVMGDDVNDLPLFKHASVSACPNDGYHYMKTIASIVLSNNGGHGAAREFCDLILMAQGKVRTDGYPSFLFEQKLSFANAGQ